MFIHMHVYTHDVYTHDEGMFIHIMRGKVVRKKARIKYDLWAVGC